MPLAHPDRRKPSQQAHLFHRPPASPTWGQLPEPCRQEVRRLIAQMLLAQVAGVWAEREEEEADHE
jgi:hypothetical protein